MSYPELLVDDEHLQMERGDGRQTAVYRFREGAGLVLDASRYEFRIPFGLEQAAPDAVQLIVSGGAKYTARWRPSAGRQVLDASTLAPIGPAPRFAGFRAGQKLVLGIGNAAVKDEGRSYELAVLWVALAEVE